MKMINMGRGTGKTLKLIHASEVTGYPIACKTYTSKKLIEELAGKIGANITVLTYNEVINDNKCFKNNKHDKILVDECNDAINVALDEYFGCEVVAGTLTLPMEKEEPKPSNEYFINDFETARKIIKEENKNTEIYNKAKQYIMDHLNDLEEKKITISVTQNHDDVLDAIMYGKRAWKSADFYNGIY